MSANTLDVVFPSTILIAAVASSVHCAGMCGPLVLNFTTHRRRGLYHFGRLLTYTSLGALAGAFGHTVLSTWPWSWMTAITMIAFLSVITVKTVPALHAHYFWPVLQPNFKKLATFAGRPMGLIACGILAGFLPCGQIHAFILAAALSRSPLSGTLILGALWAGSLPALYWGPSLLQQLLVHFPTRLRQWAITLIAIAGIFTLTEFLA